MRSSEPGSRRRLSLSKPGGLLHRITQSGSGVLAYFAGVPLAFAFIAALGFQGVVTVLLKHLGIDIYAHGFNLSSMISASGSVTSTSRSR